jgi:hypothetical protein
MVPEPTLKVPEGYPLGTGGGLGNFFFDQGCGILRFFTYPAGT